jgi:hypothetical protein
LEEVLKGMKEDQAREFLNKVFEKTFGKGHTLTTAKTAGKETFDLAKQMKADAEFAAKGNPKKLQKTLGGLPTDVVKMIHNFTSPSA